MRCFIKNKTNKKQQQKQILNKETNEKQKQNKHPKQNKQTEQKPNKTTNIYKGKTRKQAKRLYRLNYMAKNRGSFNINLKKNLH